MRRLETLQLEVMVAGDWRTYVGAGCAIGVTGLAFGSALITAGASIPFVAALGTAGITACTVAVLSSIYVK